MLIDAGNEAWEYQGGTWVAPGLVVEQGPSNNTNTVDDIACMAVSFCEASGSSNAQGNYSGVLQ
jgi:hypothetical protein